MNEIYYSDALSWNGRKFAAKDSAALPSKERSSGELVRKPYEAQPDGSVLLSLYYPKAREVAVRAETAGAELRLVNGYWTGCFFPGDGFQPVTVLVDGSEVLSPFLPIGYGCCRPINFLDLSTGQDWLTVQDVPHGAVLQELIPSRFTGTTERARVYLPPQYFTEPERKFPVLYLQHGFGENETVWTEQGRMNLILDNLIAAGKAEPMVVVTPSDMLVEETATGAQIRHSEFDVFLLTDLMPFIEGRYRVCTDSAHRAIAGLSMGSIETSITAMMHPELFSAVGVFSGFVRDVLETTERHTQSEVLKRFADIDRLYFRAIGDEDPYLSHFLGDDKLLEENGITGIRKIYHGKHEWNVWRECLYDFSQLIFK